MIKKQFTKIIGGAMALGISFGFVPMNPASASTLKPTNVKTEQKINQSKKVDTSQLSMAIEEMRIAINDMDNKDLLNDDNYQEFYIFGSTSYKRIMNMDQKNVYVNDIMDNYKDVSQVFNTLRKVQIAIGNAEDSFDQNSNINRVSALKTLKSLINNVDVRDTLNESTLNHAKKIYNNLNSKLNDNNKQLNIAINKMKSSINAMDNKDLLDDKNFEEFYNNTLSSHKIFTNLDQSNPYVKNLASNYKDALNSANSLRDLQIAIGNAEDSFDSNNPTKEENAVKKLKTVIKTQTDLQNLNESTINHANKVYNNLNNKLENKKQLSMAISEIKTAINAMDNKDLLDDYNYQVVYRFSVASYERAIGLNQKDNYVKYIISNYKDISQSLNSLRDLQIAIGKTEDAFDSNNKVAEQNAVKNLKSVIKTQTDLQNLNEATINHANKTYNNFKSIL